MDWPSLNLTNGKAASKGIPPYLNRANQDLAILLWLLWFSNHLLWTNATMDKAQTFQDWTIQHELSDRTVTPLKENGFDSVQSCELLNTAMIQKHFSESLTLGQTLLLQKAAESLSKVSSLGPDAVDPQGISAASVKDGDKDTKSSAATSSAVASASTLDATLQQQGLDAASLLNLISVNQPISDQSINMDNGKGLTFDPFCCNNSNSSKLYDIKDFVPTMPTEHKEGASNKVGEMELNLMDTKPKLDNTSHRCSIWRHLCTSWGKWLSRTEPIQQLVFLGVQIDTLTGLLSLTETTWFSGPTGQSQTTQMCIVQPTGIARW